MESKKPKNEKVVKVKDVKLEKAEQSRKNRQAGGTDVVVDVTQKVKVRFTNNFGQMKKGHEQFVSQFAFEVYDKNKCVEKIN